MSDIAAVRAVLDQAEATLNTDAVYYAADAAGDAYELMERVARGSTNPHAAAALAAVVALDDAYGEVRRVAEAARAAIAEWRASL